MLKIDYFNPVVEDWTPECMKEEIRQRELCDISLFVITPAMTGVYSIAEVVDDSNKKPENTVFCVLTHENKKSFDKSQMMSLNSVGRMIVNNGGTFVLDDLVLLAHLLNNSSNK